MEKCTTIMAIAVNNRSKEAVKVQEVLTKYGCSIMTRLGLHEGVADQCTNYGLIILQLCGNHDLAENMQKELEAYEDVKVKFMKLDF